MKGSSTVQEIMNEIDRHIKSYGGNGTEHHYNRVWEILERWTGNCINRCKEAEAHIRSLEIYIRDLQKGVNNG